MAYYTSYVNRMIRFYLRYPEQEKRGFMSKVDENNWKCAKKVIGDRTVREVLLLSKIYLENGSIEQNVESASEAVGMTVDEAWTTVKSVVKDIAHERGLI